jgi:hypothetical protein
VQSQLDHTLAVLERYDEARNLYEKSATAYDKVLRVLPLPGTLTKVTFITGKMVESSAYSPPTDFDFLEWIKNKRADSNRTSGKKSSLVGRDRIERTLQNGYGSSQTVLTAGFLHPLMGSTEIDKNLTRTDCVVLGISVFRQKSTTWTKATSTKVTLTTTRHSD